MRPIVTLVLFVGLSSSAVAAQDSDVRLAAAARDYFAQGLRFADASKWEKAADRFRRALTIRYSPVIAFNLASSLEELGELVEASELLYRVEGDESADGPLRQSARGLLSGIRERLGSLTVHAPGGGSGAQVTLDGLALPDVQLGAPFPVDPGSHELLLLRGRNVVARRDLQIGAGAREEVSLSAKGIPTPAELAAQEMARREAAGHAAGASPVTRKWWLWAGMGTVLAGVVAVVTVGALSGEGQRAGP